MSQLGGIVIVFVADLSSERFDLTDDVFSLASEASDSAAETSWILGGDQLQQAVRAARLLVLLCQRIPQPGEVGLHAGEPAASRSRLRRGELQAVDGGQGSVTVRPAGGEGGVVGRLVGHPGPVQSPLPMEDLPPVLTETLCGFASALIGTVIVSTPWS